MIAAVAAVIAVGGDVVGGSGGGCLWCVCVCYCFLKQSVPKVRQSSVSADRHRLFATRRSRLAAD